MFRSVRAMGLCIIFAIGGKTLAAFFDEAKEQCQSVMSKIKAHPFITQLGNGTLDPKRFCYYLEQDDAYLHSYGKTLSLLGAKAESSEQLNMLLKLAIATIASEKDSVHHYYEKSLCVGTRSGTTPALFAYENFLLASSSLQALPVGFAAIIPCDWIYREVGRWLLKQNIKDNPYERWISYYSGSEEDDELANMLNALADGASDTERQKMLDAFRTSCKLELKFWDDAYALRKWL